MTSRLRSPAFTALSLSLVLFGSGCAFLKNLLGAFKQPTLSFSRAELLDVALSGATVNLHWNLKNENPVAIKLASLAYDFQVEGHPFVSGKPPNGLQVKANGNSFLSFPAHVEFKDLAQTIQVFLQKDVAAYTAKGQVGLQTPIGVVTLPMQYSGSFDVPKLPGVSPGAPSLKRLDLSGAAIAMPLVVTNKNRFGLPFNGLSGAVQLSGAKVGSTSIGAMNELGAGETRTVEVGIDVGFMQAGMAVMNAIQSRNVRIKYDGKLDVAGFAVPINFDQNFALK